MMSGMLRVRYAPEPGRMSEPHRTHECRRQIFDANRLPRNGDDQPFDDITKLAHVTRPRDLPDEVIDR